MKLKFICLLLLALTFVTLNASAPVSSSQGVTAPVNNDAGSALFAGIFILKIPAL